MSTHLFIKGNMKARTAVHIGTGQGNDLTDALIRRNSEGMPIIPGTALGGTLRAMVTRLAPALEKEACHALSENYDTREKTTCTCPVCQLFGNLNPKDEEYSEAHASKLLVFDALLQDGNDRTVIRDGVGIDRMSGVAARAAAAKFELEVLPAGAIFELRLELRDGDEIDRHLLAVALKEWSEGRAWIGGRVARGLGGFSLEHVRCSEGNLNESEHLMAFLRSDNPWQNMPEIGNWVTTQVQTLKTDLKKNKTSVHKRWMLAEFTLQADGPLVVNDTSAAGMSGFDHAPLMVMVNDWGNPALPGSSLRGVLRSQAERIARTLVTLKTKNREEFLAKCPACDPLASRLNPNEGVILESCASLIKRPDFQEKEAVKKTGMVDTKYLCLACQLFGSPWRGSRLIVEDASFTGGSPQYKMLDFLAIDRFTGGGADGKKFDALVLWQPSFQVRIYLDDPQEWELGWLALTLRDLHDGWLRVGMGAAKGLGRVKIAPNWKLRLGFLGNASFDLPKTSESGVYDIAECTPSHQQTWLTQAEFWVQAFTQKLDELATTRPSNLPDSYWGRVDELYKPEVRL